MHVLAWRGRAAGCSSRPVAELKKASIDIDPLGNTVRVPLLNII